jgi:hypothetical protein
VEVKSLEDQLASSREYADKAWKLVSYWKGQAKLRRARRLADAADRYIGKWADWQATRAVRASDPVASWVWGGVEGAHGCPAIGSVSPLDPDWGDTIGALDTAASLVLDGEPANWPRKQRGKR